jgi:uncharacterized protein
MKGDSHPTNDVSLNPSSNENIRDVIGRVDERRRLFVKGGFTATALASAGGLSLTGLVNTVEAAPVPPSVGFPGMGFESLPASVAANGAVADVVRVPAGYRAELFVAWGDPIMAGAPAFVGDASETAADQAKQFGMNNDGMHFFPLAGRDGAATSDRGLLCVNNEYTHEEVLFPGGPQFPANYTLAKTRKSQAAHGVSILEARRLGGNWRVMKNSRYGRRITANTMTRISGPAAGHALMKTVEYSITDSGSTPTGATTDGTVAYGTVNNCANGYTPWGTYLTCEENWNGNFGSKTAVDTSTTTEAGKLNRRYGVTKDGFAYFWHETDPRWDVNLNPNETNLFGWVVEIDPYNPTSTPVKRTALGRFKHESVQYVVDKDSRIAFYMGDDERNEYIYKFVSTKKYNAQRPSANRGLLDDGILYVARFDANLGGVWLPLVPGTLGVDGVALRDNPNFVGANDAEVQAKILIKTRMAADALGATMMDRPEWTGARPRIGGFNEVEIYCTLTNNNRRGGGGSEPGTSVNAADGSTGAGTARPPVDTANPRADNDYGHIIRWREAGQSVTATTFAWDIFVQAGDSKTTKKLGATYAGTANYQGNIVGNPAGSADYGAPDGLWFDDFGRLWVQTDQVGNGSGDFVNIGANVMVCADPNTGETRRFLTSPNRCEVTGVTMTPDGKTMFVGVQHPGEDPGDGSTSANPTLFSNWPQSQFAVKSDGVTALPPGRPRASVVVITKDDGGIIGT